MSIDKWLMDEKMELKKKLRDQKFQSLTFEEKEKLKKKQIRELLKERNFNQNENSGNFFTQVIKFKDWLNNRHYLKGDIQKIEVWIKNLNEILNLEHEENDKSDKSELKDLYKTIPPDILDDKYRIILYKKLYAKRLDNSDRYYLKKLKILIKKKLTEAQYYEILNRILEAK